jgi:hypothetical protein
VHEKLKARIGGDVQARDRDEVRRKVDPVVNESIFRQSARTLSAISRASSKLGASKYRCKDKRNGVV